MSGQEEGTTAPSPWTESDHVRALEHQIAEMKSQIKNLEQRDKAFQGQIQAKNAIIAELQQHLAARGQTVPPAVASFMPRPLAEPDFPGDDAA